MFVRTVDRAFVRFQRTGQPAALALVFDRTAPELLRLARHLAARGVAAEDLLQQTFVTAIENRRQFDPAQPVLPWLVGILNNHARVARRRLQRPLDPQRLPRDAAVDPGVEVEVAELGEELERTIDRLPEPCRPVLRLHLRHGLGPQEVARSLERPEGTVRAQLHRGLASLRRLLPAGFGAGVGAQVAGVGLAVVRRQVLQRCGGLAGGAWGAVTTWGVALMLFDKKFWTVAVAAVFCLGIVLHGDGSGLSSPPQPERGAVDAVIGALVPPPEAVREPPASAQRTPAAPIEEPVVPPERASGDGLALVEVTIVDHEHAPVAGLSIACGDVGGILRAVRAPLAKATDDRGVVVFEVTPRVSYSIESPAGGPLGRVRVADATTATKVTYVVGGAHVTGRVLDADGVPVPGAAIFAHGLRVEGARVATADAAGRFTVRFAAQQLLLQARASGHRCSTVRSVQAGPGEQEEIDLRLGGRAGVLAGRVLTPEGRPAAAALVSCLPFVPDAPLGAPPDERAVQVVTSDDGTFRIDEAPMGEVLVTVAGNLAEHAAAGTRTTIGTHESYVELQFAAASAVVGRLTEHGRPLEGVVVHALVQPTGQPVSYLFNLLGTTPAYTDHDGRFRLDGLVAGHATVRAVRDRGTLVATATWPIAAGETKSWELDVAGHELLVRVEPATPPDGGTWTVAVRQQQSNDTSMQPADARGVARFAQQQPGDYRIFVQAGDVRSGFFPQAQGDATVPGADVVLCVSPERLLRHRLRGRVVDEVGAGAAGQALIVREVGNGEFPSMARATTGVDGFFELAGLPTGTFEIHAVDDAGVQRLGEVQLVGGADADAGVLVKAAR